MEDPAPNFRDADCCGTCLFNDQASWMDGESKCKKHTQKRYWPKEPVMYDPLDISDYNICDDFVREKTD